MWWYQYYLKNGTQQNFYIDDPLDSTPEEWASNHKDEICESFIDHFPITVEEYKSRG